MTTDTAPAAASTAKRGRFDPLVLSGLVATLVAFAASAPADPSDTSAAGLRAHLADHAGAWQLYAVLMAVSAAVLVVFVAHLRSVLVPAVRAPGRSTALPDVAFAAGILVAGWLVLSAGFTALPAFADVPTLSDATLVSYWGLGEAADMVGVAAFTVKGLCMVAVGLVLLRSGLLGAWIGWLSLLLGALTWLALALPALLYAGIFGFALWPLSVSIALVVRGTQTPSSPGRELH
jgi:hypothetical protein